MIIIDSHVHVGIEKYEPVEVLLDRMAQNRVDKAVLVQYGGNPDNAYMSECMRRHPGKFVGVAIVDTALPDASEKLEYWVTEHGMQGIRLGATVESPGPNPYMRHPQPESHDWRASGQLNSPDCEKGRALPPSPPASQPFSSTEGRGGRRP